MIIGAFGSFLSIFAAPALQRFADQAVDAIIKRCGSGQWVEAHFYVLKIILPKLEPPTVIKVVHALHGYYRYTEGQSMRDKGCASLLGNITTGGDSHLSEVVQYLLDNTYDIPNALIFAGKIAQHLSLAACCKFYDRTMNHSDAHAVFERILANMLSGELSSAKSCFDEKLVETVLNMIEVQSATASFESADRQHLVEAAKSALQRHNLLFSVEHNAAWASEKFDALMEASSEALSCYEQYYKSVLSSGKLSGATGELMVKCISAGFTTSITKPKKTAAGDAFEFSVIYSGVSYHFVGEDAARQAAVLAKAVVGQSSDLLAAQYKDYCPLFPNIGGLDVVAAVDLPAVSTVDSTHTLTCETVLVSYIRNGKQSIANGPSGPSLLLFERRSYFGDVEIDAVTLPPAASERPLTNITKHPQQVGTELRLSLFGSLSGQYYTVNTINMPRKLLAQRSADLQRDCQALHQTAVSTSSDSAEVALVIFGGLLRVSAATAAQNATFTSGVVGKAQLQGESSHLMSLTVAVSVSDCAPLSVSPHAIPVPVPVETSIAPEEPLLPTADQIQFKKEPNVLREKLQELYAAQDTLPKLIDDPHMQAQSMKDYYIKLNIVMREKEGSRAVCYDKVVGDKESIEIENILESQSQEAHQPWNSHRVLLLGGAGVGKTTLMHFVAYRWSLDQLWSDRFDYLRLPHQVAAVV